MRRTRSSDLLAQVFFTGATPERHAQAIAIAKKDPAHNDCQARQPQQFAARPQQHYHGNRKLRTSLLFIAIAAITAMPRLSSDEIRRLDPYTLLAVLGKKVIRPGGCGSSETIFRIADFQPQENVLDIGCGVGTTAIQMASRFNCQVTALDIDNRMIEHAEDNIRKAGVADKITLKQGDIQTLPFADSVFDAVTIEAVSMFTQDQQAAIREAVRACRPGGYVFDHEFVWAKPPPADLRQDRKSVV